MFCRGVWSRGLAFTASETELRTIVFKSLADVVVLDGLVDNTKQVPLLIPTQFSEEEGCSCFAGNR